MSMTPARIRLLAAALAVASCVAALAASSAPNPSAAAATPHPTRQPFPVTTPTPCDRTATLLAAQLRRLHADPTNWSVGSTPDGAWGVTHWDGRSIVSNRAPCWVVPSDVSHEWMHQLQIAAVGRQDMTADWGRTEMVADCGSWLLGSTYTPYIDSARRTGSVGCTRAYLDEALGLISDAGVAP